MAALRSSQNPILTPAMVRASRPDFEVVGVFNPGVARVGDEVLLLVRVAEAPLHADDEVAVAGFDPRTDHLDIRRWQRSAEGLDVSDPRVLVVDGRTWLTSISHLRVARSSDGIHFEVDPTPALFPATELESFGIEDPRITLLDGTYWVSYTAVSPSGIATALASTRDFRSFQRHGLIFPPPNRNVTIFPERIGGRYAALHRPMPEDLGTAAIWMGWSPDLIAWGDHRLVATARPDSWDDSKVGGGAVPFRVKIGNEEGWLAIYHGVRRSPTEYALGALLLEVRDPSRVLARSREPILRPEAGYERQGFFGNVVFSCGLLPHDDLVRIYYGAADQVTAVADLSLAQILASLT